jgi:hypothetical protein
MTVTKNTKEIKPCTTGKWNNKNAAPAKSAKTEKL